MAKQSSTVQPTDMSASFLSGMQNIQNEENKLNTQVNQVEGPTQEATDISNAKQEGQINESNINTEFSQAQQQIEENQATGENQIQRGLDVLQLSPGAIKSRVDAYNTSVANFTEQINTQLENLTTEQANAIQANDINTANQIQTIKTNYLNTQQTLIQNQISFFTGSWNAWANIQASNLQQEEINQTNATNGMNLILQAHPGTGWDSLSSQEQSQMQSYASSMGVSLDTVKSLLNTSPDDLSAADVEAGAAMITNGNTTAFNQLAATDPNSAIMFGTSEGRSILKTQVVNIAAAGSGDAAWSAIQSQNFPTAVTQYLQQQVSATYPGWTPSGSSSSVDTTTRTINGRPGKGPGGVE